MCELVVAECGMAVTSALGPPTFVWAPMASEQLLFFHSLTHLYGYPKKVGWLEEVSVASQQVPPKKKKKKKNARNFEKSIFSRHRPWSKSPQKSQCGTDFFLTQKNGHIEKAPKKVSATSQEIFFRNYAIFFNNSVVTPPGCLISRGFALYMEGGEFR
jgi:hypothetical protein